MSVEPADLARLDLLAGLPRDDLDRLAGAATRRVLSDGEELFAPGQPAASLFGIIRGRLVLRAATGSAILMSVGSREVLGWTALREDARWITSGRAAGETTVVVLPVDAILELLASGTPAAERLIRRLFGVAASHLEQTQAQLLGRGHEAPITGG